MSTPKLLLMADNTLPQAEALIRSRKRVADHAEVFTPEWLVEAMLDLVKDETTRIDSRFLEPACGSGNFLVKVLQRKLAAVEAKYGKSDFERRNYSLLAGRRCSKPMALGAAPRCRAALATLGRRVVDGP